MKNDEPTDREEKSSPSPAKLVKVATFPSPWSAHLALQALEQGGLHAAIAGQYLAGAHPALGLTLGVHLLVPEPELDAAREVLAAIARGEASGPET